MNRKACDIMKALFYLSVLLPALGLAQDRYVDPGDGRYRMDGVIVGYKLTAEESKCFIAIKADADALHSYGYHEVLNKDICSLAKMMYVTHAPMRIIARDNKDGRKLNTVTKLASIIDSRVYWPLSYETRREKDELR